LFFLIIFAKGRQNSFKLINEINITVAFASVLFALGLLFYNLFYNEEAPVYRRVLRLMAFAYGFFGLVGAQNLWSQTSPNTDDILMFQTATLIISMSQAFLFTYALILLIHPAYVTRKRVVCEIVLIVAASAIFVTACFILPTDWIQTSLYLFILFYVSLLIKYTRIFIIIYRNCLQRMDNFFSGVEAKHLRWVIISFYAALSIGLLGLAASLFPAVYFGAVQFVIVCKVLYLLFYLYFAIRIINHGFVYKKLEAALSDSESQTEPQKEETNEQHSSFDKNLETNLKVWLSEKHFLQSGVTVEDVARQIGTNRNYLSEHINSNKGKNFRQWISELRIEEAKRLLREYPEMTINDIAFMVGFVNKSHFGKTFLAFTNFTPKNWRVSF
jgi:AraC-like DNA-binding protein